MTNKLEKEIELPNKKYNIIELKNSKLKIAITDGGWVNCIKLKSFLNEIKEQEK